MVDMVQEPADMVVDPVFDRAWNAHAGRTALPKPVKRPHGDKFIYSSVW